MTQLYSIRAHWFLISIVLVSCSSHENNISLSPSGLIKYVIEDGDTLNYFYDDLRRIIKTERPIGQKTTWEYGIGYVIKREISSHGEIWEIDTLILNELGLVGNQIRYLKRSNSEFYDPLALYIYLFDNNKYLIEFEIYDLYSPADSLLRIFQYTVTDGNISSEKSYNKDTPDKYLLTEYSFFADKENSIGNDAQGTFFLGMSNKNPVHKKIEYTSSNSPETRIYSYIYKNKKITKISELDTNGVAKHTWEYAYY